MAPIKVCLAQHLYPQPFDVQYINAFEKPKRLLVVDFKTKLITSDKALITRL